MPTIRLLYASEARDDLNYRDFLEIMERAAATNEQMAITGMLCYGGGKFLQALEGERILVNALYHHIATDPRHTNCQLLRVDDIAARDFPEWSMKMVDWSTGDSAERRAVLFRNGGSIVFDPFVMTGEQATTFMRELAASARELLE